jgi:methionyl-tRNA formyltransferase
MKVIAIGTSEFLIYCIRGLIKSGLIVDEIITLTKNLLPDNSIDLKEFAFEICARYFEVDDINSDSSKKHIRSLSPDLIFASWPKILDLDILNIPTLGVIGTHPTALPYNRGRHPLHWQIVLGLRESKLSFFWMDSGVDTGKIILQTSYQIEPFDTIQTLSNRLNKIAYSSSEKLGTILYANDIPIGYQQDCLSTNTWRKRDRFDVLIDFRMNSVDILALIRSFTEPYPCAFFIYENFIINVISASVAQIETSIPLKYLEPGHIVNVDNYSISIKTSNDILIMNCKQNIKELLGQVKYLHPPTKYLVKHPKIALLISL